MINKLTALMSLIGSEKTLVITCFETEFENIEGSQEQVFTYISGAAAGNVRGDLMRESIRYYLENKQCTKIVVAGKSDEESVSVFSGITFNLTPFLGNKSARAFKASYMNRVTNDQVVIRLSKQIMDHDFIRERIAHGWLSVIGVSIEQHDTFRHIFRNGVVYNDLITSN